MAQGSAERCQCSRDQHFQCVLTLKPLILHYTPNWWANIRRAAVSHIWPNVRGVECLWTEVVVNAKVEKCGFILRLCVMSAAAWRLPQRGSDSEADGGGLWSSALSCCSQINGTSLHTWKHTSPHSYIPVSVKKEARWRRVWGETVRVTHCASYQQHINSDYSGQRLKRFNINFLHNWSKQHKSKQG